jgi:hypothetical protein
MPPLIEKRQVRLSPTLLIIYDFVTLADCNENGDTDRHNLLLKGTRDDSMVT